MMHQARDAAPGWAEPLLNQFTGHYMYTRT